jgi:hypothetical protein
LFWFSSPVGPSGPRAGAGIVSTILPHLGCPGVRGSGFGRRSHFRRENLVGSWSLGARAKVSRAGAAEGRRRRRCAIHLRSQPAGRPAGQARTARTPRQPSRAGNARPAGPPGKIVSRGFQTSRAHRGVSGGGANGAVLHLPHRAPIVLRHRTLNPEPSSDPVLICRIGQSQSSGLSSIVGQLRRAHAFLRPKLWRPQTRQYQSPSSKSRSRGRRLLEPSCVHPLCRAGGPRLSVMFPPAPRGKSRNPCQSLTLGSGPEPATCTARAGLFKHYAYPRLWVNRPPP